MKNQIKIPGFVSFILSPAGRLLRVIAGIALIITGFNMVSTTGYIIAAVGMVPLLAGAFDICILGRILGGPYQGDLMRQELHSQLNHPELGPKSASFLKA